MAESCVPAVIFNMASARARSGGQARNAVSGARVLMQDGARKNLPGRSGAIQAIQLHIDSGVTAGEGALRCARNANSRASNGRFSDDGVALLFLSRKYSLAIQPRTIATTKRRRPDAGTRSTAKWLTEKLSRPPMSSSDSPTVQPVIIDGGATTIVPVHRRRHPWTGVALVGRRPRAVLMAAHNNIRGAGLPPRWHRQLARIRARRQMHESWSFPSRLFRSACNVQPAFSSSASAVLMPSETVARRAAFVTTSWDDGHPMDVRLAALLEKHGVLGTFYVPVRYNQFPVMNGDQIRALRSMGMEIGSHTVTHPKLTRLRRADVVTGTGRQ